MGRRGASFAEGLLTLGVVAGNLFLPNIAAACVSMISCFHTQMGASLMAFSTLEECEARWTYMPIRALLFLLTFAAGPWLWRWLIRHTSGGHALPFLTASYRAEHQAWEANRLTKNMAMASVVAAFPVSYCPGSLMAIAVCITLVYAIWHVRCQ